MTVAEMMMETEDSPTQMEAIAASMTIVETEDTQSDVMREGPATRAVGRLPVAQLNVGSGHLPVHHLVVTTIHLAHVPLIGAMLVR